MALPIAFGGPLQEQNGALEMLDRAVLRYVEAHRALVEAEAVMLSGLVRALADRQVVEVEVTQEAGRSGGRGRKITSAEYMRRIREQPYLNPNQAAHLLRKSKHTIYQAMQAGELEFISQGHRTVIKREDLDDWMERGAPR